MSSSTTLPSTPLAVPPGVANQRLFTVADVAAMPAELPSGPIRYEIDNGRLITMPPAGDDHGSVESNFDTELNSQGKKRGHGQARCGDVGIILWRNPDRLVGADVVFISNSSLPIRKSSEGYLETIPDLVVEVKSKNDTWPEIERKVADYLRAGVRVVWVADPAKKTVTVYRAGQTPQVLTEQDVLSVEDIIPGFRMLVAEAFD